MNKLTAAACTIVAAVAFTLSSCEKPYVGLQEPEAEAPNTVFRITAFEQIDFDGPASRAVTDVSQICSRINLVVYSGESKVKSIAQKASDKDFGTLALTLPPGTYTVAIIAHSTSASATISSLDKVSFDHNLLSDTFLYKGEITIGEDAQTYDVQLRRIVAMFRLNLTKALPSSVAQMKFYYTGGSSTLSAVTGYGSVNSKQTVVIDVSAGQQVFEVYTIPHAESGSLKMTITAIDATQNELYERVFEDVPVTRNKITQYTGDFFDGNSSESPSSSFAIKAVTDWDGEQHYDF
ncbi:MAG: FimB/Mfa2 family fimbrial subunit [Bacteroidaceae bacterium]|nr:FimB/Mfa2 family fimbrial subunit [Bacteroidaceae bacterium]